MINNWESSLEKILHHEGGYVEYILKLEVETNLGVTKEYMKNMVEQKT